MALSPDYRGRELPARDLVEVEAWVGDAWEALRDRTILLTGGTGFFGLWLLETLAHANAVRALNARAIVYARRPEVLQTRAPHLLENPAFEFVRCDVRTAPAPARPCAFVIHAATESSAELNLRDPAAMADTIVRGTAAMLEIARGMSARLLLLSSGAVYGPQPPELTHVPEGFPGAPDPLAAGAAYALAKRLAEHLGAMAARNHGQEVVIARGFAFVGPHLPLHAHFAIGNFIRDSLLGRPIVVNGDGRPFRSYLYAGDLAAWLWVLLVRGASPVAYNVGSPHAVTIAELAGIVAAVLGNKAGVHIARPPETTAAPGRYVPEVSRAGQALGLRGNIGLEEAIRRTGAWYADVAR